jgi:hypothetical protein
VAALIGRLPSRVASAALLAITIVLAIPIQGFAADPSPDPGQTARPPTCAERFPAEGPAGVDLRLGCIVGEVAGLYRPGQAGPPAPLSTYAIFVGVMVAGAIIAIWLLGRLIARRAGRRLAPVLPGEWWVCSECTSVNGAGVAQCYSCRSPRPDGPSLMTDDRPSIPQSFGSKRKRG